MFFIRAIVNLTQSTENVKRRQPALKASVAGKIFSSHCFQGASFSLLPQGLYIFLVTFVIVVYFILRRLLYLAYSANLGLLCMPHPVMGPLV